MQLGQSSDGYGLVSDPKNLSRLIAQILYCRNLVNPSKPSYQLFTKKFQPSSVNGYTAVASLCHTKHEVFLYKLGIKKAYERGWAPLIGLFSGTTEVIPK